MLSKLEAKATNDRGRDQGQFHFRHVAADAGAGTDAKRDKSRFLLLGELIGGPAFWPEGCGVGAPDARGVVDGVGGYGEHGAGGKGVVVDCDGGTGGNEAGEAEGGSAVDTEGFVDDLTEAALLGFMFSGEYLEEEGVKKEGTGEELRTRGDLERCQKLEQ